MRGVWARGFRDAIRQLAEARRRLAAAEEVLADALAAMKQAAAAFDAANDRFAEAEGVLDAAREDRARRGGTGRRPGRCKTGRA